MPLHLIDLRGPEGPYWAAYQDYREKNGVYDNPDHVPDWFMARVARQRVAAARVELQNLTPPDGSQHQYFCEVFNALRTVEMFIRETNVFDPGCARVVAGLLGAGELPGAYDVEQAECRWCGDPIMFIQDEWRCRSERYCALSPYTNPARKRHEPTKERQI